MGFNLLISVEYLTFRNVPIQLNHSLSKDLPEYLALSIRLQFLRFFCAIWPISN